MQHSLRSSLLKGFLVVGLGAVSLLAQEQGSAGGAKQETAAQQSQMTWKIVNTAIFAVLLGWMVAKAAPKFFNARSADIAKAIKDATGLKIDADFRYSEMDRKMATLSQEVARMRAAAQVEFDREHERIRVETGTERDRMRRQAAAEVENLRLVSEKNLRLQTADAALVLAEQRLRALGPAESGLIQDFVHLVERGTV